MHPLFWWNNIIFSHVHCNCLPIIVFQFWFMFPLFRNWNIIYCKNHCYCKTVWIHFIASMSFNIRYYSIICLFKYCKFFILSPMIWNWIPLIPNYLLKRPFKVVLYLYIVHKISWY